MKPILKTLLLSLAVSLGHAIVDVLQDTKWKHQDKHRGTLNATEFQGLPATGGPDPYAVPPAVPGTPSMAATLSTSSVPNTPSVVPQPQ